MSKKTKAW
jgi:hypothetical protein